MTNNKNNNTVLDKQVISVMEHKVIVRQGENIIKDFLDGKFTILGLECNCLQAYGSPLQKRALSLFPNVLPKAAASGRLLGSTDLIRVWPNRSIPMYVANMYTTLDFGRGHVRYSTPKNGTVCHYKPEAIRSSLSVLILKAKAAGLTNCDHAIGMQRLCGGIGGVPWDVILTLLDSLCAEHCISIYVYLPAQSEMPRP